MEGLASSVVLHSGLWHNTVPEDTKTTETAAHICLSGFLFKLLLDWSTFGPDWGEARERAPQDRTREGQQDKTREGAHIMNPQGLHSGTHFPLFLIRTSGRQL